jgi:hypothetical protein
MTLLFAAPLAKFIPLAALAVEVSDSGRTLLRCSAWEQPSRLIGQYVGEEISAHT